MSKIKQGAGIMGVLGFFIGFVVVSTCLSAWVIMVVWGALASHFDFDTIGFGTAILVGLALSIVGGFFSRKN